LALLGEIDDTGRFRSADTFAALAGVARFPASSGQSSRLRLNTIHPRSDRVIEHRSRRQHQLVRDAQRRAPAPFLC